VAEDKILHCMESVVFAACERLEDAGIQGIASRQAIDGLDASVRQSAQVVWLLCDYAMDCLQHKAVSRDQNAGLRRGLAFQILAAAIGYFDLTGAFAFVRSLLARNRPQEVRGPIVFLEDYFKANHNMPVPDDIVESLLSVAKSTPYRSTAVGALNVLVEAGAISEYEALDRIGNWKQEHYYGK
jgi:hypothetical protein